jgi:hypothetical protein
MRSSGHRIPRIVATQTEIGLPRFFDSLAAWRPLVPLHLTPGARFHHEREKSPNGVRIRGFVLIYFAGQRG